MGRKTGDPRQVLDILGVCNSFYGGDIPSLVYFHEDGFAYMETGLEDGAKKHRRDRAELCIRRRKRRLHEQTQHLNY